MRLIDGTIAIRPLYIMVSDSVSHSRNFARNDKMEESDGDVIVDRCSLSAAEGAPI